MKTLDAILGLPPREAARALEVLAAEQRWREIPDAMPVARARLAAGRDIGLEPGQLRALAHEVELRNGDGVELAREAARRAVSVRELLLATPEAFCARVAFDTDAAITLLDSLRDANTPLARRAEALFPDLAALARADAQVVSPDYDPPASEHPLLDHLAGRTLSRKLAGLESGHAARFQPELKTRGGLSREGFDRLVARMRRVEEAGLLPLVRLALLFRDIAKPARDTPGTARLAHNEGSAQRILARSREQGSGVTLVAQSLSTAPFTIADVALFIAAHGLVGQHLRGEGPLAALAHFVAGSRRMVRLLDIRFGDDAPRRIVDALSILDACDTASVREGLYDDALATRFEAVERVLAEVIADPLPSFDHLGAISTELREREAALLVPNPSPRAVLTERLARLRASRTANNPAVRDELDRAVGALSDGEVSALTEALGACQLWYAERATADLAPDATLRMLTLALHAAARAGIRTHDPARTTRLFHIDLLPLARYLDGLGPSRVYALRLLETILAPVRVGDALANGAAPSVPVRLLLGDAVDGDASELGALQIAARGERAIALEWRPSREADALLTLLAAYERKNSAAFHATLKSLCDLYGLRKDDFDRIQAEASYLDTMNAARSDKARLCDYVVGNTILEVGPGGGVVLDLVAERYPRARVLGLDSSRAVVEALTARKATESRRWEIVEGDAFTLQKLFGARALDTVIFCSILHEIYSYVPWDDLDGKGARKFSMGSVKAIMSAAFRALAPGGRIVVRDGVMPPPATRVIEFADDDVARTFEMYARDFQGRKIVFEKVGERRVKLSSADAHAFLFTFVWGPASFPYEIREQYGVETYDRYAEIFQSACNAADPPYTATRVPLSAETRSYLQPGYVQHLAPWVTLFEDDGKTPARLPDSNALWVIEKSR